jgi:hypothetical protein
MRSFPTYVIFLENGASHRTVCILRNVRYASDLVLQIIFETFYGIKLNVHTMRPAKYRVRDERQAN